MSGILEMLISEVRYGKATLPEGCRSAGRQAGPPFSVPLQKIYEKMQENTGDAFGDIFCSCMKEAMETMPLTKQDREIFLRFAANNSFAEEAMQVKWMEQSRDMLDRTILLLEEKMEDKCRIAVGLGAMSGLLLIIILL